MAYHDVTDRDLDTQVHDGPRMNTPADDRNERVAGVGEPAAPDQPPATGPVHRTARLSAAAAAGAIISVVGLCAVLTGLLAPEGLVISAVGLVISVIGGSASARPGIVGRGLAGFGIVCALAALVLAILAMTGTFSWPNSATDETGRWHAWLVAHWSWLSHWS